MKYIKTYESINKEPKIGDWVIVKDLDFEPKYNDELSKCVGKIIDLKENEYKEDLINTYSVRSSPYFVEFEKLPKSIKSQFKHNIRTFYKNEILFCSDNKEDLEAMIAAQKYNL